MAPSTSSHNLAYGRGELLGNDHELVGAGPGVVEQKGPIGRPV